MKFFPFRWRKGSAPAFPRGKANHRCYAIGDVHGCIDQLRALLDEIARDHEARPPVDKVFVVMVGDLIDRGPDSKGVIDLLQSRPLPFATFVFLAGNHEELFVRILAGEHDLLPRWLVFGGRECALSYGVDEACLRDGEVEDQAAALRAAVPDEHIAFLETFRDGFRFGDYLFVHAGIRPGVPLAEQDISDLRWIRGEFLDSPADHGVVVVHGHTIFDEPDDQGNRIGIDTGAYRTGRLTAIGIEEGDRWFLSVEGEPSYF